MAVTEAGEKKLLDLHRHELFGTRIGIGCKFVCPRVAVASHDAAAGDAGRYPKNQSSLRPSQCRTVDQSGVQLTGKAQGSYSADDVLDGDGEDELHRLGGTMSCMAAQAMMPPRATPFLWHWAKVKQAC